MPKFGERDERRLNRFYFGGVSSATAACFTHPLDLIKVLLQTQQEEKLTIVELVKKVYKTNGILGYWNGLSASVTRQLTYTLTRFGIYETCKNLGSDSMIAKMSGAIAAGVGAGIVGLPADVINVRMQNDVKLPPAQRRNYKSVFHGFIQIYKHEGPSALFYGFYPTMFRGIIMTMSQNMVYDMIKKFALKKLNFEDNVKTHITSSFLSAGTATFMTQPFDVIKTRLMSAKPGEFKGTIDAIIYTSKGGPTAFFKGFFPSFFRIAPHTVLVFVFMEQLRLHFGKMPIKKE